ncbi:HrpE/YscL family type III secretion apparatus protein [Castellaniella sp. WN]
MAFLVSRDALNPRLLAATPDPAARVLRAADYAALVQARAMLDQAGAQADAILAGARDAFEAERRRGYEDGKRQALLDQAEKMIEIVGRTVDYFAGVENEMVDLVMAAVRKVVDGFDDREKVVAVVRNALAVVRNQKQMTLRLHPDDVEVVRAGINDILAAYPGVGYLDLLPDARLARGACILESEIGMVEASLEGQIEALRGAFQRMLGSRI